MGVKRSESIARQAAIGSELLAEGGHFRVWAPAAKRLHLVIEAEGGESWEQELEPEEDGYYSGLVQGARAGMRYGFRINGREEIFPDPASRFQPEGPHGRSQIVDPAVHRWSDGQWRGLRMDEQVLYELHIGTFTSEGTWQSAVRRLPDLADLGVTAVEVMPVADFAGDFGWGYDGVDFFAPTRLYGEPDDFRDFVDEAHRLGLGVILDVVYNHSGPDGNYLSQFSPHYVTDRYACEWGDPFNFDGEHSGPVREFFIENAAYWVREFHVDGLRLDAANAMVDASPVHVLSEITRAARSAAGDRSILLIAEMEPQPTRPLRPPEEGGWRLDALWNDDFHHSAVVALTGRSEAYYSDHSGAPQEFISAAKYGLLFQGQYYTWQGKRRGGPTMDFPLYSFVNYLENHDQVANSADGHRSHQRTSSGRHRAMVALFLLMPGTPMLFQGQEFAASAPFLYFADHKRELRKPVRRGRAGFLQQFPSLATPEMAGILADPFDRTTFERCKIDSSERERHRGVAALYRDLLAMRRSDPAFAARDRRALDGAVLGPAAFLLRFMPSGGEDRLMLVNFGPGLHLTRAPEPLLAPPEGRGWTTLWSSESPRYGGLGSPPIESKEMWEIPGESAVILRPVAQEPEES